MQSVGLLPKIDQLRYIARLSNAAVVKISKSKLDKSITNLEILIDKYDPLHDTLYYGKIMAKLGIGVWLFAISDATWVIHKRIYF